MRNRWICGCGDDVAWVLSARPPAPDDPNGYWLCEHLSKDPASADSGSSSSQNPDARPSSDQLAVRLSRPHMWAFALGDVVLAWKVDPAPPRAWWVGRVVGFEWRGLYRGEADDLCIVQPLQRDAWQRDPDRWVRLRPACLVPLPAAFRPNLRHLLDAR